MPGSRPFRIAAALVTVQSTLVLLSARAFAAPTPPPTTSPTPSTSATQSGKCEGVIGPLKESCERSVGGSATGSPNTGLTTNTPDAINPLASLAKGCADAASWIVGKLGSAIKGTATVDFTNPAFLQQYAVVFAASTILTLVLWLLAVAKRAIRGVPLATAMSEAIGFLWLTVLASAFTPSSCTPSSPPPTPSPGSSPPPPAARATSSSAPSPKPSRRATTSAAARSC